MADPPRLNFTICGSAGALCNNSSSCSINVVVVVVVVVVEQFTSSAVILSTCQIRRDEVKN